MAKKNPAAVALGRLGGKKGGPARAKALSAEQLSAIGVMGVRARLRKLSKRRRSEIAKQAAAVRWSKAHG